MQAQAPQQITGVSSCGDLILSWEPRIEGHAHDMSLARDKKQEAWCTLTCCSSSSACLRIAIISSAEYVGPAGAHASALVM